MPISAALNTSGQQCSPIVASGLSSDDDGVDRYHSLRLGDLDGLIRFPLWRVPFLLLPQA